MYYTFELPASVTEILINAATERVTQGSDLRDIPLLSYAVHRDEGVILHQFPIVDAIQQELLSFFSDTIHEDDPIFEPLEVLRRAYDAFLCDYGLSEYQLIGIYLTVIPSIIILHMEDE